MQKKERKKRKTTHGMAKTPEFKVWGRMRRACYKVEAETYHIYGGRGIGVCPTWKDSFINFYNDMGPRPKGCLGIQRLDITQDFSKINCKWVGHHSRLKQRAITRIFDRNFKNASMFSIRVEREYVDFLVRLASKKAIETGKPYTANNLVRELVEAHFVMPKAE